MNECTGDEILSEMLYHLGLADKIEEILPHCIVRTAMMPYITSQFMSYTCTDRSKVVPDGCTNICFIGQFIEIPGEVVFTAETSVCTPPEAVLRVGQLFRVARPVCFYKE